MDDKLIPKINTIHIPVLDLETSKKFYTEMLGLHTITKDQETCLLSFHQKGAANLTLIQTEDVSSLTFNHKESNTSHHSVIDFYTTDIQACHHYFHDAQLSVSDIEQKATKQLFYVQDPNGHWLSMSTTNPEHE